MKKTVQVPVVEEGQVLLTDIVYSYVPFWFDFSLKPLKLSILMPKRIMKPEEDKERPKKPLLVWICGGGMQTMDKDVWIPDIADYAKRGFVIASVSYRTSPDAFPEALKDIKSAIRFLKAHAQLFCIDPDRVVVMGESAGGMLASSVGITNGRLEFDEGDYLDYSSRVHAVVSLYGPLMKEFATSELGEKIDRLYAENKDNIPPFMILQGTEDVLVDKSNMDRMYEKLETAGIPCDYYIFDGAGHGAAEFYQTEIKDMVIAFVKRFFMKDKYVQRENIWNA